MADLFDETESDDDITVAALWLVKRCTLDVASLEPWRERKWQKSAVSVVSGTTDLLLTCYGLVAKKSVTSWQLPRLRGSYGETFSKYLRY